MEFTNGIFNAAGSIYKNNRGSILRTVVYTLGHFIIAISVLMLVADVSFAIAIAKDTSATNINTETVSYTHLTLPTILLV